ncbi:hypothetical protein NHQ30_005047 [Ciborinia camelliae]|nr:hypothetical protein NHQ30_005047 [Ciborinia camelliae]
MPPKIPAMSDNEKLLIAALSQLSSDGNLPPLNYGRLSQDLGLPTANAAQVRWSRLTTKIKRGGFTAENLKIGGRSGVVPTKRTKDEAMMDDDDDNDDDDAKMGSEKKRGAGSVNNKEGVTDKAVKEKSDGPGSFKIFEDPDAA